MAILAARALSQQFAEPLEHVAAVEGLFAEPGDDDHGGNQAGEHGSVAGDEVVARVDLRSAEQRHHDCFEDEFVGRTESDADRDAPGPAPGPHEAELVPWRLRGVSPHKHEQRAKRREEEVAGENRQDGGEAERAEAPQRGGHVT